MQCSRNQTHSSLRELLNTKVDQLEKGSQQTKDQLAELTRTANDYSTMLQRKEDNIVRLASEVVASKRERTQLQKDVIEINALTERQRAELDAYRVDADRTLIAKARLQEELDELRALKETKTTEETRRREVEKSKDEELADLRRQVADLQGQLNSLRKTALDNESKLKLEVERASRQHAQLESSHMSLRERERATSEQVTKAEAAVVAMEKSKRTLESELQALRAKQIDSDSQLAEAVKAKEVEYLISWTKRIRASNLHRFSPWSDSSLHPRASITTSRTRFYSWREELTPSNANRSKLVSS
jgi:myosin protein heavy chain